MKKIFPFLAFVLSGLFQPELHAQDETARQMDQLLRSDSVTMPAIAAYPKEAREHILTACTQPAAIIRIENLQAGSSVGFRNLVSGLAREDQQKIWDLSRYPGLISKLAAEGKKSGKELEKIAAEYPEEIRSTILDYGGSQYVLLKDIHNLELNSNQSFEAILREVPQNARQSLREMLNYPEAIRLLGGDMRSTLIAGDIFQKNPELMRRKLDSLAVVIAEQNAKELKDWKDGLDSNPQAKSEFEAASKEFAEAQGYQEQQYQSANPTVVVQYVVYPYHYWYGYPWWYDYPYWYPYPYWYHWGYYYGPYGFVWYGWPSPFFMNWYFHHHHHHYHYCHFTDYCVGFHHRHRNHHSGLHREISQWENRSQRNLPKDFFADNPGRAERIRELGKFEVDYNAAARNNPGTNINREDFLRSKTKSYPNISPVLKEPGHIEVKKPDYQRKYQPAPNEIKQRPGVVYPPVNPWPDRNPSQPQRQKVNPPGNNNPPVRNTPGKTKTVTPSGGRK